MAGSRSTQARNAVLVAARAQREAGTALQFNALAAMAGVGVGTVYRHFDSPEHLVEELTLGRFSELTDLAAGARASGDPDRVRGFFVTAVTRVAVDEDFARAALNPVPVLTRTVRAREDLLREVTLLLESARTRGDYDTAFEAPEVLALLCGVAQAVRGTRADARRASAYTEAMLRGLRSAPS